MEEINLLCKRADTYLHSAQVLITDGDFNSAVSRTYYAMFYMTQVCFRKILQLLRIKEMQVSLTNYL
jgi:uncharacterized protein (UPF0332 family)